MYLHLWAVLTINENKNSLQVIYMFSFLVMTLSHVPGCPGLTVNWRPTQSAAPDAAEIGSKWKQDVRFSVFLGERFSVLARETIRYTYLACRGHWGCLRMAGDEVDECVVS